MKHKIITISREFGSGGRYIGELVAKRLGIPCYDKALIEKVAKETGLVADFVAEYSEHAPAGGRLAYAFAGRGASGESLEKYIFRIQQKVILDLAEQGPCVIIGRSADVILKNAEVQLLNVFIYGSAEGKKERLAQLNLSPAVELDKLMKEIDKKRSVNYKHYTGQTWGDPLNYDIMLNSSSLGAVKCAEIIAQMY